MLSNRNCNFLTSGTGTVTCLKAGARTGTYYVITKKARFFLKFLWKNQLLMVPMESEPEPLLFKSRERNRKFSKVGTGTVKKSYGFATLNRTDDCRGVFPLHGLFLLLVVTSFVFLLSLCHTRQDISFMHLLVATLDTK